MADWPALPEHAVVRILSYLHWSKDVLTAAKLCRRWYKAYKSPQLWRHLEINIQHSQQEKELGVIEAHGCEAELLLLRVEQTNAEHRLLAMQALHRMTVLQERRLEEIRVEFTAENPLFYGGSEFVDCLAMLFADCKPYCAHFVRIDLHLLQVKLTDHLLNVISLHHHASLTHFDIQNQQLVCLISPEMLSNFIKLCKNLLDLRVFHCSLSDEGIRHLLANDRQPLQVLSALCSGSQDKFLEDYDIQRDTWIAVREQLPELSVVFRITHRCPANIIQNILKSEIPMTELQLDSYSVVCDEVKTLLNYAETLRALQLRTPSSDAMQAAIVQLMQHCQRLERVMIATPVQRHLLDREIVPNMSESLRSSGKYAFVIE